MDDIGGVALGGLVSMVGFGWVLHVRDEEPGEWVLFFSMVLGLYLQAVGHRGWVPWLWFGTLVLSVSFYAVAWTVGWGKRDPHRLGRHDRANHD